MRKLRLLLLIAVLVTVLGSLVPARAFMCAQIDGVGDPCSKVCQTVYIPRFCSLT